MTLVTSSIQTTAMYFGVLFLICSIISWFGVRWLIEYLKQKNMVDLPNDRSMHQGAVPRGGGAIIVMLVLICIFALAIISDRTVFFAGLGLIVLAWAGLSWSDDKYDLSPALRLSFQALFAITTVFLFGWVDTVFGLALGWAGPILSVFGVLWMANLNNFMDGMDGLAASQSIIASLTLGIWFLYLGDTELAIVCVVMLAASYGFLLWNWHPAKIFMGDVGSISLGALYATLIILASNRHEIPIVSLLLIFAVFITDATYTILNRARKREPIWLPHRSHFYQRAGLAGASHSKIVLVAIILMVLCSLFATLSVLYRDIMSSLLVLMLLMLAVAGFAVVRLERNSKSHTN